MNDTIEFLIAIFLPQKGDYQNCSIIPNNMLFMVCLLLFMMQFCASCTINLVSYF